ncbi:hypothetical protein LAZ67_11000696, partial [Cordylochernes scorpioides]
MATTNLNYPRFREGEDLNCYLEQLEECFKLNKTLEADKVSVLLTSIDVNVYKTLRDLLVPRRPSDLKYKDLVEVLTNHLYPIKNKHYERYLFHKIVQKESEPVGKFVLRLKSQADKCKFTDINENLCDQFVSGCFDEATLKRLLSEPFLTFDSAINIANSVEAAKSQVNLMKNPGHDIDKLKARSKNFKFPCKYNNPCKICGNSNHDTKLCKFKNAQCYICNKKGHIAPVCWNKKSAQNSGMNKPNQNKLNTIQCNTLENAPKIMVNVKIEDADTIMEVDTGADVSVVSKKFFLTNLKNVTLEKYSGHLKSFSGNLIPVFGKCLVNVSYKNYQEKLPLIVTGQFNNQTPLLGRNWIRILKADWPNCVFDICNNINVISNLELFLEVYKRVFENKDLPIQGIKGSISLRPNAKPKFFKFRPVPFSIKEKIDKELDRLEKSQIIEKVNASDWSTPLVTVIKSNGELRLCGDFKNTLNNCIEDEKYPLPTIETMLGNLGGNKIFTKLDLSSAYHQIEMDEASKNLLVVSTHRGLYRYNRLPFGISPASAIFQRCMDSLFHDVPNTVIYLDDIFIGSKDEQEHYRILKMIFDKLKELNFTLNKEKCLFLKKDICFLGHIINEDGVRPDSKKLEALERCKKPFDKTSLKSFLGMLSFYSKYIPNMSTLAGPLYQLLKKDNRWKWSSQCEKAFLNLKLTLLNSQALIHYSMKLPLTLTCDASAYGISGVLCHIVEGEEKPITFVSRTLSSAEVKYSQTEKEALAIVFATSKLRQYLFGRKFVLKSDHKALTTVFGNKRLLPPLIANRLHRWALELSNFDFDIRYTNKDTMLCADAFSRLPLEEINSREDNIDLVTHDISFLNVTPLDHLIIEEETNKDPVLNKLKEYLLEDPQLAKKDETMKPFLSKLENFSVLQGCIFVYSRAVIPRTCQDQMLKLLHQSHIGINRMKSLARSSVWWPKMDSQIEEFVKECSPCMHHQTSPPAENTPWPRTNQPWQRVHVDHFYFRGDCYLLVVDANSNWIEVFPVRGTTSQENIKLLRECFARYGLPQCLVSDNGPPFNSIEFKEFLRKNNVYHLTSPAYNPSSNGIAEVSVRIIKKSLEKSLEESPNPNMDCILQNVLFNYRNTPTSLDKPPVERLLSYVPRTFVNCLNSEFIQKTFGSNECGRRHFQVGDNVLFTRVIQNRRKWFKAQVIRRLGYNVYLVKNLKGTFKVHVNQMRTGSDTKYAEDSDWTLDNAGAGPHRLEQDPQISTSPPPRRSTRPRCLPCRDPPYLMELKVEGNFIKFEMDTGSGLTLISEKDLKNSLQHLKLEKASIIVRTYDGTVVPILGKINVKVECQDITYKLRALVVKGEKRALMGREWINRLKLGCFAVKHMPVEITIEEILKENQALFVETTEPIKGFTFSVNMCDVNPIFHKARPVPFAIRPAVTEALDKMVAKGYLCEVASSKWATPMVVVPKKNKEIRICCDFKVTLNKYLDTAAYPLPTQQDLFSTLAKGKYFSKLDLRNAYLQLEVDPGTRPLLTINTHKGLFRFKRMPFGLANAPSYFQSVMDRVLSGHLVTGEGFRPLDHKVQAIQKAKTPMNISELRSFLGLVNFYGKFIPNLPELLKPLHELLHKKRPWVWTKECGEAIDKCKNSITSERVLVPYDTTLPLCLATDASQIGVGAVLSHIIEGQERPIMFASRTLSEAEQNYSQIEKEALAIIYGVTKFHQFIYGRKFILITDHKPLVTILGSRSGIPTLSTSRLERWALILSAYTYDIKFRRTQDHGNADLLSRFPVGCEEIPRLNNVYALSFVEELPITAEEIATETEKDEVLSLAKFYTQQGWPEKVADHLRPYFQRKLELTVDGECLVWGMRVVIPPSLRIKMLNCLHETHSGMNKMMAVARSHFWRPNLDTQIEFLVNKCRSCQQSQDGPNKGKWQPWKWSTRPWQRIHIDFANKENINLLIVFDSHSKWIEAIPMRETTTRKTIEQLRRLFSSYGLPEELVSDNGPQFTGSEMKGFLEGNGIKQTLIPAYHPQSNGLAERAVRTIKTALDKNKRKIGDTHTIQDTLSKVLLAYRSTPHVTTGKTPSELFIGRALRTRVSLIHPSLASRVRDQQDRQMKYDRRTHLEEFQIDDLVWCKNFRGGDKWIPGKIVGKKGTRVYTILIHGQVKAYHRDQIRKRWRNGEEDESGDGERQPEHSRGAGPSAIISEVVRDRGYMESMSPGLTSQRSDQDSEVQSDTDDGKSLEPLRSLDPEALKEEGPVLRRNPPRARRHPTDPIKPATPAPAALPAKKHASTLPSPAPTKRKQSEAPNPPAKRTNLNGPSKPVPSHVSKPAAAQVILHGEKSAAHTVVISDDPQADPREMLKTVRAAHTLPQGVWASLRTKGKLVLHSSNPDTIPEVTTSLASKLNGMKVRQQKEILPRICLFKVDEETSNSTIEETFLETAAVRKLPGDKVVRVAHRSAPRNGTCTAFIEVDLKTFRALGVRGRIVVDGVILNFEESIRARVCFRCCGFGHNSAQCTKAPKCFHCGEDGHEGRTCPSIADQRTSKCANCCSQGLPDKHEARASSCPILKSRALKSNHFVYACKLTAVCGVCKLKHHTLLHAFSSESHDSNSLPGAIHAVESSNANRVDSSGRSNVNSSARLNSVIQTHSINHSSSSSQILLSTALIRVNDLYGNSCMARALVDTGSQRTLITDSLRKTLNLPVNYSDASMYGIGDNCLEKPLGEVDITFSPHYSNMLFTVKALILNKIICNLPNFVMERSRWPHLVGLRLADPTFDKPAPIDIIIGADNAPSLYTGQVRFQNETGPTACNSKLGWLLSGKVLAQQSDGSLNHSVLTFCATSINNQLRKFWELDSIPPCTQPILTKEEMDCEQHFKTNVSRTTTGRYQESTTTNLRVVFDASACSDDSPSLNKALHIGPKLQTDIFDLLLRFRTYFVALSADIEKMYRQILIHPDDSDYQRVLWRDSSSDAIQEYKLTTITYGTACAPYLAIRTLHQLADDEAMNYPVASEIMKRDFYVDDLLTGADTVEEAQVLIRQIIALLAEGVKLLGILWDPTLDSFTIRVRPPDIQVNSKRSLLSLIARIYDPLGWMAPLVIIFKIMLQKLWAKGCNWDERLPECIQRRWTGIEGDVNQLNKISIPRYIPCRNSILTLELHGFCDSSEKAYAAVIYVKSCKHDGSIDISLIASKTKVAPIKALSLPRLELCSALLLANLFVAVKESLSLNFDQIFLWSDSTIALNWIKSESKRWKTFVANRVSTIQRKTPPHSWFHVPGSENPADLATRGLTPAQLVDNQLWWQGPHWLQDSSVESYVDLHPSDELYPETLIEERSTILVYHSIIGPMPELLLKYSSWIRTVDVMAFCLRFISNCKSTNKLLNRFLSASEVHNATVKVIILIQNQEFTQDIGWLQDKGFVSGKSNLRFLNPFLDADGILRVGGRLQHSNLDYNRKHPIILPKRHHCTDLIIEHYHKQSLHSGLQTTLSKISQKYWIISCRAAVKRVLNQCITCFKHRSKIVTQIMAIPDEVVDNLSHISRWKCIQSMKNSFWKKWSQDYLNLLQARPRWHKTHQDLQSGQLVLMKQDSTPPHHWPLARIIKTYKGPDGHVRVVDLKTPKNKNAEEPLVTLALLALENSQFMEDVEIALHYPHPESQDYQCQIITNITSARTEQIQALIAEVENLSGTLASFKELDEIMPQTACQSTLTDPTKPATPSPADKPASTLPAPVATKRKQPEAFNPPAKRPNLKGPTKLASSRVSKPAAAQVVLHGEKSAAHTVVVSDDPQADPRDIYKAVRAAHTLPQGVWASLPTKGKLVLHSSNPNIIPEVTTSLASKLTGMKVRQQKEILPRICLFRVDEETSNSTIEETFLATAAVSQLPGNKVVRVAHRSALRNGTCTAFIEVDLKTFGALGNRGRIVVD